jgi:predicted Zn-dependent protease
MEVRATLRLEKGDFEGARQDADRVIAQNPGNVMALSIGALLAGIDQDWPTAAEKSAQALRVEPQMAMAVLANGLASAQLGNVPLAKQRLQELREFDSSDSAEILEQFIQDRARLRKPASSGRLHDFSGILQVVNSAINLARDVFGP